MAKLWLVNLSALLKSFCHTRPGNLARRISREFGHLLAIRSMSQKFISQIHMTPISGLVPPSSSIAVGQKGFPERLILWVFFSRLWGS